MSLIPPSLTPTIVSPTRNFPGGIGTFPNSVPFTYRDGSTFSEMFEQWIRWVEDDVVPGIVTNANSLGEAYNFASIALAKAMDDYKAEIAADRGAFEERVTSALETMAARLAAADAARVASEAARDESERWAAQTHALQDLAVKNLTDDATSQARASMDRLYKTAVSVREFGAVGDGVTDDTAAIQAALNTGASVVLPAIPNSTVRAVYLTTNTLTLKNVGQRLTGPDADILPKHGKDVVQVSMPLQVVTVNIVGGQQPEQDYTEIAAIRIGGTAAALNPLSASVTRSTVSNFRGNGIIWEHGAMVDFTGVFITDVTVDGIRCTEKFDDNNHGHFLDTHIIRAGRNGYSVLGKATTAINLRSRSHQFLNSKAFQCGRNYYIETLSNVGTIFTELSVAPCMLSADSNGNFLEVISTETDYENVVDNGQGNAISGYSRFGHWDSRVTPTRKLRVNNLYEGRLELTQTAKNAFVFNANDTNDPVTVKRNHLAGGTFIEDFQGAWITYPGNVTETGRKHQRIVLDAGLLLGAGGTYLANPDQIDNIGPGWIGTASISYAGDLNLIVTVNIHPAGYSRIVIYNPSSETVNISRAVIQVMYTALL